MIGGAGPSNRGRPLPFSSLVVAGAERVCKWCGAKYVRPWALAYCSRKCCNAAWNASDRRAAWELGRRLARQHKTKGGQLARAHYHKTRMVDWEEESRQ